MPVFDKERRRAISVTLKSGLFCVGCLLFSFFGRLRGPTRDLAPRSRVVDGSKIYLPYPKNQQLSRYDNTYTLLLYWPSSRVYFRRHDLHHGQEKQEKAWTETPSQHGT